MRAKAQSKTKAKAAVKKKGGAKKAAPAKKKTALAKKKTAPAKKAAPVKKAAPAKTKPGSGKLRYERFTRDNEGKALSGRTFSTSGWGDTVHFLDTGEVHKRMKMAAGLYMLDLPDLTRYLPLGVPGELKPLSDYELEEVPYEFLLVDTSTDAHAVFSWRPDDGFVELSRNFDKFIANLEA